MNVKPCTKGHPPCIPLSHHALWGMHLQRGQNCHYLDGHMQPSLSAHYFAIACKYHYQQEMQIYPEIYDRHTFICTKSIRMRQSSYRYNVKNFAHHTRTYLRGRRNPRGGSAAERDFFMTSLWSAIPLLGHALIPIFSPDVT